MIYINNLIEFFYGIVVDKVNYNNKYYSFVYNGYLYKLYICDKSININTILDINRNLINNTLVSEIIMNKMNEAISIYNDNFYVLIRIYVNLNKKISLDEIDNLSKSLYKTGNKINWGMLWSKKIDYLEYLINENGKKYPLIVDSFNYFVGMAENAISYYNNIGLNFEYTYFISHKSIRVNDTIETIYNPLNIIFDFRVRDVAEYIKNSFFNNNVNIFRELNNYLVNANLSLIDVKLLISRILYPSFYFDMYEDILIDEKEEKIMADIIDRIDDYEKYLYDIISFFRQFYDIDDVKWLKK